jgi:ATP-dependent helicase HepA
MQIFGHFQAVILNRELALERRRSSPPESGPVELWQGQVAALERSLSMARVISAEASAYIQEYGSGRIRPKSSEPISILLALVSET